MAWNVKPSATTQIQQPSKPYLTKKMRDGYAAEILPRYEKKQGALMPILNDVQHRYRCIPPAAMVEIARFLEIAPADSHLAGLEIPVAFRKGEGGRQGF